MYSMFCCRHLTHTMRLVPVEGQNGVLTAMLAPASSPQPGPYRLSAMRGHSAVILVWMLLNGVSVQGQCPTVGGPSSNAIQCTFGTPVDSCPAAYPQRSGLLCYERCPDGMSGDIGVCKMNCPSNFREDGLYCFKPSPYDRGAGYPWHLDDGLSDSGMWSRCERDNGRGNCQKDGLIVYPRCRPGFHQVGCCICSPDCPSDTTDVGISCQKNLHGVGGPKPLVCPSDRKMDGVLLSCVPNDCVTDALPALSGTPTNKQAAWMQQVQYLSLFDLKLPGAHDAGMYRLTGSEEGLAQTALAGMVGPWSQTQGMNLYDQLSAGIRYLDLRIAEYTSDSGTILNAVNGALSGAGLLTGNTFAMVAASLQAAGLIKAVSDQKSVIGLHFSHSLLGPKLVEGLADIRKFLNDPSRASEVFVISLRDDSLDLNPYQLKKIEAGPGNTCSPQWATAAILVNTFLGEYLIPPERVRWPLKDLLAAKQRVLLFGRPALCDCPLMRGKCLDKGQLELVLWDQGANSNNPVTLRNENVALIQSNKCSGTCGKFTIANGAVTLQALEDAAGNILHLAFSWMTTKGYSGNKIVSLRDYASFTNYQMMDWVRGTSEKRFTVLAADFPHQELIDVIVSQNIGLSVTCAQPPPIACPVNTYQPSGVIRCDACPVKNCRACQYGTGACTACAPPFQLNAAGSCECPIGLGLNATGICVPCQTKNCKSCSVDYGVCQECTDGAIKSGSGCQLCPEGSGSDAAKVSCAPCQTVNCAVCPFTQTCSACKTPARLDANGQCTTCPAGQGWSDLLNQATGRSMCTSCADPNCADCGEGFRACRKCTQGWIPIGGLCSKCDLGFGIGTAADGSITCVPCKTPGCTMCAANYTICQSCNPKDYESQPVEGVCKANWYNMTGGVTSANFMINATVCSPKSLSDVQTALAQAMWPLQQRLPAQNVSNVVFAIASQTGCPGPCTTTASIIISVSSSLAYGLEVKSYLSGLLPAPGQAVAVPQGSLGLPAPVPMGVGCFTKQDNWNALFYLDGPRLVDAGNQMCHLVVRPGDTFWGIAMSLKFTTEDLLKANPAVVPTQLQPGQIITLPNCNYTADLGPCKYRVQLGDIGETIAFKYGVTTNALVAANPGVVWTNLQMNQILNIPCQPAPSDNTACQYKIQAGDTYCTVAFQQGTTVQKLLDLNPNTKPELLQINQGINIPCGLTAPCYTIYTVPATTTFDALAVTTTRPADLLRSYNPCLSPTAQIAANTKINVPCSTTG